MAKRKRSASRTRRVRRRVRRMGRVAYRPKRRTKSAKSFYAKNRRNIGERVGTSNSFTEVAHRLDEALSSNALHAYNLTDIVRGQNDNQRQHNVIRVAGFQLHCAFQSTQIEPLWLNLAVVSPKQANVITTANFFRAYNDERARNFGDSVNTGLMHHCLPLNTDKFNILWHYRSCLGAKNEGNQQTYNSHHWSSYKLINKWIPLKRQLRFDAEASTTPMDGNVFIIYWFTPFVGSAPLLPISSAVNTMADVYMYYRQQTI